MTSHLIGIDLHGTLLDDHWEIKTELRQPLIDILEKMKGEFSMYVCSGNDLTFIKRYIPPEIETYFDGYILETGCVMSSGDKEEVIVGSATVSKIKELEKALKSGKWPEVRYFARRLATISMFTRDEEGGIDPAAIYPRVKKTVNDLGFAEDVMVTHSNVAVDIIPAGYNKFTGMAHVAGNDMGIIGIADSLNDYHMIAEADMAFIPANASYALIELLKDEGRTILPLSEIGRGKGSEVRAIYQSAKRNTSAVIDILNTLYSWYIE